MKTTMKKTAAYLLAILLVFQVIPAVADDTVVSNLQGPITSFREKLQISAVTSTLNVGMTIQLTASDNFDAISWKSSDTDVATVDKEGNVTGIAPGQVTITAKDSGYSDTITLRVVDNSNEKGKKKSDKIMVFITGEKKKETYDGQDHILGYTATSDSEEFDPELLHMINPDKVISAKNCNVYQQNLTEEDFQYDGETALDLVITNGWLQIKPKAVTVTADSITISEGDPDPELTATVTGLYDEDTISYTLECYQGEGGVNIIDVYGDEIQGNYKIQYIPGVMTVIAKEGEQQEPLAVTIVCLHPAGEPVEYGMGITLEATVTGAEEGEYTIQWQYSTDFQNWVDIPGANSLSYTFTANGETVTYSWRAVADRIQ